MERAWTVLVRAIGTAVGVEEELAAAGRSATDAGLVAGGASPDAWQRWRGAVGAWPVVLRVGADPAAWPDAISLVERHAGHALGSSATVPRGCVRVGLFSLLPAGAAAIRLAAAGRGWPVTLERADPATRSEVGVWGALPPGALAITERLRRAFDPAGVFDVPLSGAAAAGR
jgi:hypothetical protein